MNEMIQKLHDMAEAEEGTMEVCVFLHSVADLLKQLEDRVDVLTSMTRPLA